MGIVSTWEYTRSATLLLRPESLACVGADIRRHLVTLQESWKASSACVTSVPSVRGHISRGVTNSICNDFLAYSAEVLSHEVRLLILEGAFTDYKYVITDIILFKKHVENIVLLHTRCSPSTMGVFYKTWPLLFLFRASCFV